MARGILTACLLLLVIGVATAKPSRDRNNKNYRLVCYLGTWAWYRPGDGAFNILNMDPHLCTHLMYGFAKLENDRITPFDPYLDIKENWGLGYYEKFNSLRNRNPELTTIIAIGGWNEGSMKYSDMARDPARRRVFVNSVLDFLQRYNFDGLDFDWEYPASREGSRPEDKENFVQVLKELKEAFDPHGYVLTAAVSAGKLTIDPGYDVPQMARYLDFINLMAYDYHGIWESVTGHNSPLYAKPEENHLDFLNVNYSVNYWLDKGFPKDKLVLGMPLYGRCFQLASISNNGFGAPTIGAGQPGKFTNEPGMIGYNELCFMMKQEPGQWKVIRDAHVRAPIAIKGNQWCGYDDPDSLGTKVDYIRSMGLSGGMVWSLETDDFHGRCSGVKFPLLSTIKQVLTGHSPVTSPPIVTNPPVVTVAPTAKPTGPAVWCEHEGIFGFPGECSKYFECVWKGGVLVEVPKKCSTGSSFDLITKQCLASHLVTECGKVTTPAPTAVPVATTTRSPIPTPETTASPQGEFPCSSVGNYPHPTDCTKFYRCQKTPSGFNVNHFTCPSSLVFNPVSSTCDYVVNVPKCQNSVTKKANPISCGGQGYHPYPGDCSQFVHCTPPNTGDSEWVVFQCPKGLYYQTNTHICDWARPKEC